LYLDDDFGEEFAGAFLFDIAAEILVAQLEFEFQASGDVGDARVGSLLGVQLAAKDAVGFDADNHVGRAAIDGHIVTRRQLISFRFRNLQIRILCRRKTKQTKQNKNHRKQTTKRLIKIYDWNEWPAE
jgi:hypothetical protein